MQRLAVLVAFAAVSATGCLGATAPSRASMTADTALAASPEAVRGGSVPLDLTLPTYPAGIPHSLREDRGHVTVLDVWASWCAPCRDALPFYEGLADKYAAQGLRVYAVNIDADRSQVKKFLEKTPVRLPLLYDQDAKIAEARLGIRVMPTTFFIDRSGRVRRVHEGFLRADMQTLEDELQGLLSEK